MNKSESILKCAIMNMYGRHQYTIPVEWEQCVVITTIPTIPYINIRKVTKLMCVCGKERKR